MDVSFCLTSIIFNITEKELSMLLSQFNIEFNLAWGELWENDKMMNVWN